MSLVAALAVPVFGVSACGSSDQGDGTRTVVTIVKTAPAGEAPGSEVTDDGTGGGSSGEITVPNEVGKNHQAAQDDLQAHGLYNLSEEDATGQGRLLILDRNWKVVSQSPAAGSKVHEDATITLRSKKYTDG